MPCAAAGPTTTMPCAAAGPTTANPPLLQVLKASSSSGSLAVAVAVPHPHAERILPLCNRNRKPAHPPALAILPSPPPSLPPCLPAGQDPLSALIATKGGAPAPAPPRPLIPDLRFASEQQLQADLGAATDPSVHARDPFVAAFVSLCLGENASPLCVCVCVCVCV